MCQTTQTSAKVSEDPAQAADGEVSVFHGFYRSKRGYDLYTTCYIPPTVRGSACLIFHHGLSDHAERHGQVLRHLCSQLGMPVYTYDAMGHGRSGPPGHGCRCLIPSIDRLVDDLVDFTREAVLPCYPLPYTGGARSRTAPAAAAAAAASEAAATAAPAHANGGLASDCQQEEDGPLLSGKQHATQNGKHASSSAPHGSQQPQNGKRAGQHTSNGHDPTAPSSAPHAHAPPRPRVFLLGYSMGGLVCNLAVATTSPPPHLRQSQPAGSTHGPTHGSPASASTLYDGLMLTSGLVDPLYGSSLAARLAKMAVVTLLAKLVPGMALFKRNPIETGIRDPAAVLDMHADTLWYRGKYKAATICSLLWGCERLRRLAPRMCLPVLAQAGTVDTSCTPASLRAHLAVLARQRPTANGRFGGGRGGGCAVTLRVYDGAFHDLHHDPETPAVLGEMVAWLRAQGAGA